MQRSAGALHHPPFHIYPHLAKGQGRMVLGILHMPAQQRADTSQQLSCSKRLHQIVISP
jgi:hypothetical protein